MSDLSAQGFLESKGLGEQAHRILDVTGAESLDDLRLIDDAMVDEVVKEADLKLVVAKKFRVICAELRGEVLGRSEEGGSVDVKGDPKHQQNDTEPQASQPEPAVQTQESGPQASEPEFVAHTQEYVAICIDRSGSMRTAFKEVTLNVVEKAVAERTRLEAVKAMFYAFRDRVESLQNEGSHGRHQLGLLQFDDVVETLLGLTPELNRFEAIVDDMECRGCTAIYSSIIEAVRMLESHFDPSSKADFRVLVLSDGQSNRGDDAATALEAAHRIGAVVDSIVVGNNPDSNLRRIVTATGGECYQIENLGEGFELLESESVVSLLARRGGEDKPPFERREVVAFDGIAEKTVTSSSAVQRAPTLSSDLAAKSVVRASQLPQTQPRSASEKRLYNELSKVQEGNGIHIFPAADDLHFWRALIEGPPGSPFEGGVFALHCVIPKDYPFKPPKITFETPIYHCNVNDSGGLCLDILKDNWSPALSVFSCLWSIRCVMSEPNPQDALRQWIAELTLAHQQSGGSDTRYYDKARESCREHASLSVDEWRQRFGC